MKERDMIRKIIRIRTKEKQRELIFSQRDHLFQKSEAFRTRKVNLFFVLIAEEESLSEEKKMGTNKLKPC